MRKVLKRSLFVKAEKCKFSCSSTAFLGYIISTGKISMDPEKVKVVEEWPRPGDRKALQRFLGFANFYRRSIQNYSTVTAPHTALTSSKVKYVWEEKAEEEFKELKRKFTTAPIFIHPDPKSQFIIEVDNSNIGIWAILSQCSLGTPRFIPASSIPIVCPRWNRIMRSATESSSWSS